MATIAAESVGSVVSNRDGQISELGSNTAHNTAIEMADPQQQQMEINDDNPRLVPRENGEISRPVVADRTVIESNPAHSNDRGHIKTISTLFAASHGLILTLASSMYGRVVSSVVRQTIVFLSALVSTGIIASLVVICFQEFSLKRGGSPLRNSLIDNRCWVTRKIALVVMFMMFSQGLFIVCYWLLKPRHH